MNEESITINLIQHFIFCKRQWGLMVLEDIWVENQDTILGNQVHEKAHNLTFTEKRESRIITRGLPVASEKIGIHGITDIVEFHEHPEGIEIKGFNGKYLPTVVEYKKGKPKSDNMDVMQLVAQVYCIEEMHNIKIEKSYIYYKLTNRRFEVSITDDLRLELVNLVKEMRNIMSQGETPMAIKNRNCKRCSLIEKCWPRLTTHKKSVKNYIEKHRGINI